MKTFHVTMLLCCLVSAAGGAQQPMGVIVGPVPIESYSSSTTGLNAACPSYTPAQCIKYFFSTNPGDWPYNPQNYTAQGVTGVRFQFVVVKAFDANGNLQPSWVSNLQAFLNDLKRYGIKSVTPTPVWDNWGGGFDAPFFVTSNLTSPCSGKQLVFWKWLPFGHVYVSQWNYVPDCVDTGDGYFRAASNPYFWGWQPEVNLVTAVIGAVRSAGLTLDQFQLFGFDNDSLTHVPVVARMIYDNTNSYDFLGAARSAAGSWAGVVTPSTGMPGPTSPGYDCVSAFGDSATMIEGSALWAALNGQRFGYPSSATKRNGLVCGGTPGASYLPRTYSLPSVLDAHAYPGFGFSGDITSTAIEMYNDLYYFASARNVRANIGETYSNQNADYMTTVQATQNANGYTASLLYTQTCSGFPAVMIMPWENEQSSTYIMPNSLVPPYPASLPTSYWCCSTACQTSYNRCVASCPPPGTPGNANQLCMSGCSTGYNGCMSMCH